MTVLAFLGAAAPSIFISLVLGGIAVVGMVLVLGAARRPNRFIPALIVGVAVALLVFGGMAASQAYTTIQYGTVGLVTRFEGLTGQVFEPGLHWRTPFIEKVVTVTTVVQSYETSDDPSSSGADYTDIPVNAQTIDGQQIHIKYTVLFRIPASAAAEIAQNIGTTYEVVQNVVKAHSRNLTRLYAQSHSAEGLYSGEGIFSYEDEVRQAMEVEFSRYGVILDDFLVRKIEFDMEYIQAIEQQQIAQEAIQTAQYQSQAAEYERDRQIRLAEADAQRIRLTAEADAERQHLLADSEAYSIRVRGETLEQYPQMIQWEFVVNLQNVQWGILPSEGVAPLVPIPSFEGTEESPLPEALPAP